MKPVKEIFRVYDYSLVALDEEIWNKYKTNINTTLQHCYLGTSGGVMVSKLD